METITATEIGFNCDFDYGEGWMTICWETAVGLDAALYITLDGFCYREMPIRSGQGPPDFVDLSPESLRLRFSPELAAKLELPQEVEFLYSFPEEDYAELLRFGDYLG